MMTELERVRAEFEQYMEAAHKAGVVFSVTRDGLIAEYDPALAKCVASWDADQEIEQPMPDKANEHAAGDLQEILILNQELERALDALQALLRIVYCAPLSARSGDEDWPDRAAALLLKHRPPAPDSTRKRDGVAGDVQPLRPREQ